MVRYINVGDQGLATRLTESAPYRAIVICDDPASESLRNTVSELLCETGCRYMMAWGHDCSRWDDAVDLANLEQFDFNEIPAASFVMTTWHSKESLEEVFWFAKNLAFHDDVELQETVLLHLGSNECESAYLHLYAET